MSKPAIDHIGVIVAALDQALALMKLLFKAAPAYVKDLPEVGLKVAAIETANVTIELLQYCSGGDSAFARQVMGAAPGLNHISARVDNLEAAMAELAEAGFAIQPGFPRQGAHGRVAFYQPDAATGLLFEICQPDKDVAP